MNFNQFRKEIATVHRVKMKDIENQNSVQNDTSLIESKTNSKKDRITQIIVDWIIIVIIAVIAGCVYFISSPTIRYFTCDESDIFYPYQTDIVPFWAVGIFGSVGPVLTIIIVEIINLKACQKKDKRTYFICIYHALTLFVLGAAIVICITEIGKKWVGRLRPHFMSVCQPIFSSMNCTSSGSSGSYYNPIYTGGSFCTGSASLVLEARVKF